MMEIQSPNTLAKKVFLAGSIEMGKAEDWQKMIVEGMVNDPVIFYNPRRDDWNTTWEQSIDNEHFNQQVTWELDALDDADIIVMYFDPNTQSPISLLELGLYKDSNMIVLCPEGFWRKGNVDIVCKRYGIHQVDNIQSLMNSIRHHEFKK